MGVLATHGESFGYTGGSIGILQGSIGQQREYWLYSIGIVQGSIGKGQGGVLAIQGESSSGEWGIGMVHWYREEY